MYFLVGLKTNWDYPETLSPQPLAGDIIEFKRKAYVHAGIADGRGGVYHLSGEPGVGSDIGMKSRAYWKYDRINDVAKDDRIRINNSDDYKREPLDQDEIISRCKEALQNGVGNYNVVKNNCEHNANDMRYGSPRSRQVETASWATGGLLLGVAAAAAIGIGVYAVSRSNDRRDNERR